MSHRIVTIVGARPQFIKAAALSRTLAGDTAIEELLVHTGQHFDDNMSEVFFRELMMPAPHFNLDIHGGPHGQMTGRMLEAIEQVLLNTRPALVLVYGDTNSTLAGALAAAKLHIPVAHVEAGLRSFNRRMPEEINRVLVDHMSGLLFCPTFEAVRHLHNEGISAGVHHTGDIMYDATLYARSAAVHQSDILARLALAPRGYVLCTLHRSENTDSEARLAALLGHVREVAGDLPVVMPLHPRTRQVLAASRLSTAGLRVLEPLGYFDMHALLGGAAQVLTDSGGVQKEAYFHRVPCVTLRDDTEWTETVAAGWNRLWTTPAYLTPRVDIAEYGDGAAGSKMAALLKAFLDA